MNEKYKKTLSLLAACSVVSPDNLHVAFDKVLEYIHNNFDRPVATPENIEILKTKIVNVSPTFEQYDVTIVPPTIPEELWPLAVVKYALKQGGLPLDASKLTQFEVFHRRYGEIITSLDR